ncbi:MAG TPA: dihydroorotate dehydrogenase catalytic subunit, partial [Gemmatimonadales bacterium]
MGSPDLSLELFGRRFQNPLLLASGTAGFGRELDGVMDLDRLGGLVTKAVSLEPRAGNPSPRLAEFRGGMLNSVGLANPGVQRVREEDLPWLAAKLRRAQVLVNVVGFTIEEYAAVVSRLEGHPIIAAFELNLSCPNTSAGGVEFGSDPACVARIVSACRRCTRLPLVAKLSPVLPDLPGIALAARDAGADAVTAVNTMPGLLYHEDGDLRLG